MINENMNKNWVFGYRNRLEFDTSLPKPTFSGGSKIAVYPAEGCASVSDPATGELLFYTNGKTVWDSNNNPIANGLKGHYSSTQSSIITPDPANDAAYYVFTTDGKTHNDAVNHFDGIRLEQDANGTWSYTSISLIGAAPDEKYFSPAEKLLAIPHANCKDFWVITLVQKIPDGKVFDPNNDVTKGEGVFRIFLLDQDGVRFVKDIETGIEITEAGYLKVNQNSDVLAVAINGNAYPWGGVHVHSEIVLFKINSLNANIDTSNVIRVPMESKFFNESVNKAYGLEFSPNGKYLYFSSTYVEDKTTGVITSDIIQLNVDFNNSTPVLNTIGTLKSPRKSLGKENGLAGSALQLGIDGVIYIARPRQKFLSAIEKPNDPNPILTDKYLGLKDNVSGHGLPNLLPSRCPKTSEEDDCNCNHDCSGCNENAEEGNKELIERAEGKHNTEPSTNNDSDCPETPFPIPSDCQNQVIPSGTNFEPCFYFHWGDGAKDQVEVHDTEVFYITVCNHFNDILFKGLRITKVNLSPALSMNSAHIVPDRFINIDCLEPCSCQTREFAIITRDTKIAGNYTIEVEYCYDEIVIAAASGQGMASFPLEIIED